MCFQRAGQDFSHLKKKLKKGKSILVMLKVFVLPDPLLVLVLYEGRSHNPKLKHRAVFCSPAQTLSEILRE